MHYKNGREAKNGDKVVLISNYPGDTPKGGILYGATPDGGNACNGRIAITTPYDPIANLADCLHADDIASATIPDTTAQAQANG